MQSLARFAVRQRWTVVGLWLALIVGAQFLAQAAGGAAYKNDFKLPHTEAQTVSQAVHQGRPRQAERRGRHRRAARQVGHARRRRRRTSSPSSQALCTPAPTASRPSPRRSAPSTAPTAAARRPTEGGQETGAAQQ